MSDHVTPAAALLAVACAAAAPGGDVLWDNGDPDGGGGHSNATAGVFGARRTLLDDFEVPADETWRIDGFHHFHIWNTLPPGSGTGMELTIWSDRDGEPWRALLAAEMTGYEERGTGRTFFARPETEAFTTFEPFELEAGRWWLEGTVVGPENDFWLTRYEVIGSEHWVNYDDLGGLQPGTDVFGVASDLNFRILGEVVCAADVDESGAVDFADLLRLLSAWGPCLNHLGCPEDIDDDRVVDFADLLLLLAAWGPCPSTGMPFS